MSLRAFGVGCVLLSLLACGDDDGNPDAGRDASEDAPRVDVPGLDAPGSDVPVDVPTGARPHPLYPALDLATLPGEGGGAVGPYEVPELPTTTREVTVSATGTEGGRELMNACDTPGTAVTVPSSAGRIGVVNIGNAMDCDIELGADVVIDFLVVGSLPGPMQAPAHRIRFRGGQIASMIVRGPSTDIVFDGVAVNAGVMPLENRPGTGMYLPEGDEAGQFVDRFAVVNSFVRMLPVDAGGAIDGTPYLSGNARNVFFANNNITTAGNRNSWGFLFSGGDNIVRVSFHKLVRMNDAPVDYVYIKGGTWMREATSAAGGGPINDSFQQLSGSTTDHVYVHDPVVYLLSPEPVGFGMTGDAVQMGRSWEARRIEWHALNASVISDERMAQLAGFCVAGATCDYGVGTHTYMYDDALAFPDDPWRDLPTFDDDDPDNLPAL